jgi:hypothetical protein
MKENFLFADETYIGGHKITRAFLLFVRGGQVG